MRQRPTVNPLDARFWPIEVLGLIAKMASPLGLGSDMRRRDFITLLGGAAVAGPMVARAQQPPGKMRRLGGLQAGAPPDPLVEAMQGRLRKLGYSEGRDVAFEFRWAEGKFERLTQLAMELADLKVDAITA